VPPTPPRTEALHDIGDLGVENVHRHGAERGDFIGRQNAQILPNCEAIGAAQGIAGRE